MKPGREDEFVAAWQELAEWTTAEVPGAVWATLVRDVDNPRHFISFGPWEDMQSIQDWRASRGFQERVGKIRQMLESFEPTAAEAVVEIS